MNPDEQFISRLKTSGERVTSPRLTIFRALRQHSPLPMSKLASKAKANGIDLVTVYRTVALFKRLNLVQEIGMGSRRLLELTDDFTNHHHHFWCSNCGNIIDFDDESFEEAIKAAAAKLDIEIESHQVEIVGLCSNCRQTARLV
jgi:Fur family peroxide stress response transcriptional regulator